MCERALNGPLNVTTPTRAREPCASKANRPTNSIIKWERSAWISLTLAELSTTRTKSCADAHAPGAATAVQPDGRGSTGGGGEGGGGKGGEGGGGEGGGGEGGGGDVGYAPQSFNMMIGIVNDRLPPQTGARGIASQPRCRVSRWTVGCMRSSSRSGGDIGMGGETGGGRGGGEGGGRWREWREWQREGSEHCREQSSIARATKHQPGLRIRAGAAISCDVDELARRLKLECTFNADQRPSETWPIHYFSPLPR